MHTFLDNSHPNLAMASARLLPSFSVCLLIVFISLFLHLSLLDRPRYLAHLNGDKVAIIIKDNTSRSLDAAPKPIVNWRRLNSFLIKRAYTPASDDEWNKAIQNGCQYLRLMRADQKKVAEMLGASTNPRTKQTPAQSSYTDPADIEKWGWTVTQDESMWMYSGFDWGDVTTPVQALGLSTKIEDWDYVQTQHTKSWKVDGVGGPVRSYD
jgi:hypothetical protein